MNNNTLDVMGFDINRTQNDSFFVSDEIKDSLNENVHDFVSNVDKNVTKVSIIFMIDDSRYQLYGILRSMTIIGSRCEIQIRSDLGLCMDFIMQQFNKKNTIIDEIEFFGTLQTKKRLNVLLTRSEVFEIDNERCLASILCQFKNKYKHE